VNQFLYPLSKPDIHNSGTIYVLFSLIQASSIAEKFAEHAQISQDLLKHFTVNHRRHKGIFDFAKEKYEADSKGLLEFRNPLPEEKAASGILPPPSRPVEAVTKAPTNPPPQVEYYENGLNDINEINRNWETFAAEHGDIQCERPSDTEFRVQLYEAI